MMTSLGQLLSTLGQDEEAEIWPRQALLQIKKVHGPKHLYIAISLHNLALFCDNQGKKVEAENLFRQTLSIREKVLGEYHPQTAEALNDLAIFYGFVA